jgi:hypothetical protein
VRSTACGSIAMTRSKVDAGPEGTTTDAPSKAKADVPVL